MATTNVEPIFIDTNVLVYAKLAQAPLHALALEQLTTRQARPNVSLWVSPQVLREYLATMTRPGLVSPALPVAALIRDVQDFGRRFRVAEETRAVIDNLLNILRRYSVGGKQIHDANIVATMQAYSITQLLTHNVADFSRYADLIQIIPLQA